MNQYYTYIYKDPSKDYYGKPEPFYVGKGSGYRSRNHLRRTDHCEFIHRLQKMKQNGIEPIIEKIIIGTNEKFALGIETMLIKRIGRKDLGKGPLLNLTNGGENPPNHSGKKRPGSRLDVSKRMKGNTNGRHTKGIPKSKEAKKRMSKSKIGN